MSGPNEGTRDAILETVRLLTAGLEAMTRQVEPVMSELAKHLEPLTRILAAAAALHADGGA